MADQVQYYGTGRRKSAIARVFLRPGNGDFKVNGRPFDEYFVTVSQRIEAKEALVLSETDGSLTLRSRFRWRRSGWQAGAVKMGTARALVEFNPELRGKLKAAGLLTRDAAGKSARSTDRRAPESDSSSANVRFYVAWASSLARAVQAQLFAPWCSIRFHLRWPMVRAAESETYGLQILPVPAS